MKDKAEGAQPGVGGADVGFGDREMRRAFSTLLENVPGMAYRCANDRDWPMEFVSRKARELTGYEPEELMEGGEVAFGELIHPQDRDAVWREVQGALERKEQFKITYRLVRADGEIRWVDEYGGGVFVDGELVALEGFVTDVTEHRKVRERFLQAHKMRTITRMAGDVANGFRDLLSVIVTYAGFVSEEVEEGSQAARDIERVIDAGERAVALTRQLLKFSREPGGSVEPLNLNVELDSLQEPLNDLLGDGIDLGFELGGHLWLTRVEPSAVDQVVWNLAANAREAMGEQGEFELKTANVSLAPREAEAHAELEPGDYVLLEATDDGAGMDAETRQRAMEPYFTTKTIERAESSGVGLGLTTIYGLVAKLGGGVEIDSDTGKGTTVSVYFPRSGTPQS